MPYDQIKWISYTDLSWLRTTILFVFQATIFKTSGLDTNFKVQKNVPSVLLNWQSYSSPKISAIKSMKNFFNAFINLT